ncbi:MAG: tape measure protein [Turicibacter sp.]|nr:tape measure protein [Turicibacter sp.]
MAETLRDLKVTIKLDNSEFKTGISGVEKQCNSLTKTVKKVATAIAGAFVVKKVVEFGTAIAKVGVEYNALKEQSKVTWTTLLGSQEQAISQLERIEKFAASTPFSKMGVDQMAKYLHNAGYEGDAVFDTLTKIGDMGSAFGVQEDSLVELTRQFSQVQQAGYAYTEDLNILADRGIPIYQAIADQVGVTVAEVKKMASEGKLTADIYNSAIDSMATTTAGAMEAQSKTFNGMMSTLQDNLTTVAGLITEKLFSALSGLLEKLLPVVEAFANAYKETGSFKTALLEAMEAMGLEKWIEFGAEVKSVCDKVKDLTTAFFENEQLITTIAIVLGTLTAAVLAFNAATILSNASMVAQEVILNAMILAETIATATTTALGTAIAFLTSPITLVILAIGALIAIIYLLIKNWDAVKEAASKCWDWIVQKWKGASEWFKNVILTPLTTVWNNFWTGVKTGASNAWANLQNIWSGCVGWFKSTIISPVSSAFKGLWDGIKSFLTNPLEGIKTMFRNAFNWIIGKVNAVIGGLNKIKMPDWVPGLGGKGINIPKIPTLWKGSNYTLGGLTLVGEQGPELVNMPRGASVTPAHKTEQMLNNAGGAVEIVLKIDNFYNNTANDIEKIADELTYLIRRKKIALGGV